MAVRKIVRDRKERVGGWVGGGVDQGGKEREDQLRKEGVNGGSGVGEGGR